MVVATPGTLTNFFAGQRVEITGVARLPKIADAEGLFDYRGFLKRQNIFYQLRASSEQDWQVISPPSKPPLADRFRTWAQAALGRGLPAQDESLRLEWALTLGWKTALTEEVAEPFVRAATYHIFAVDGLRMAILFGIFFCLLRVLRVPRPIAGALLLPVIWFYVALTGWPASAIRATVMLTVIIIGWIVRRPTDVLNSLFAAALIILGCDPQQLFQAGFQLSFLVVLCIILISVPLDKLLKRIMAPDPLLPVQLQRKWPPIAQVPARFVFGLFTSSLAAWIGSIPLVAYYFNLVSPVSTPANIIAVPLCALVLSSNLASLLLIGWFPGAAELFNHAGWALMELIRTTSLWFASWPKAYCYVESPSLFTIALYYAVFVAAATGWLFQSKLRLIKFASLSLLVMLWGWQCWWAHSLTRLSVLALNGSDTIFYDPPGRKNDLLVDCGATNTVEFLTKPFLRARGVNRLPTLLLTHGDLHHIGGAELINALFSVKQVYASPVRSRSPTYRKVIADLEGQPGKLRRIGRDDRLPNWQVLHPGPDDRFPQADDNAVVLRGELEGTKVLLLSDLGRLGQAALLERTNDLTADIVVSGLPAQTEALGEDLLDAVKPAVIVVADSEYPVAERASSKLIERLARRKVPVIYTRSEGSVTIEFRGGAWELRTMSGIRLQGKARKG
jgi:competence protein ComEC